MKLSKSLKQIDNIKLHNQINIKIDNQKFVVSKNKFQLFVGDDIVSSCGFNIQSPDKWFNKKYVIIHDVKTVKRFQGNGFTQILLEHMFDYIKNEIKLNIITLIVYKSNYKAVNIYFNSGFKLYSNYEDSYSLIKNL